MAGDLLDRILAEIRDRKQAAQAAYGVFRLFSGRTRATFAVEP